MQYVIPGEPTPWQAHKGYGKKSYSPKYCEKKRAQWELFVQHAQTHGGLSSSKDLIDYPVRIDFIFYMPIPKYKKSILKRVQAGEEVYHSCRCDRTNLQKFAEDCLIGTVIKDDNINVEGFAKKVYSLKPQTIITISEICPTQKPVKNAVKKSV